MALGFHGSFLLPQGFIHGAFPVCEFALVLYFGKQGAKPHLVPRDWVSSAS